jgi:hypothetical protein
MFETKMSASPWSTSGRISWWTVLVEVLPRALAASRRERQQGIEAVERLNGSFLVDGEHPSSARIPPNLEAGGATF